MGIVKNGCNLANHSCIENWYTNTRLFLRHSFKNRNHFVSATVACEIQEGNERNQTKRKKNAIKYEGNNKTKRNDERWQNKRMVRFDFARRTYVNIMPTDNNGPSVHCVHCLLFIHMSLLLVYVPVNMSNSLYVAWTEK